MERRTFGDHAGVDGFFVKRGLVVFDRKPILTSCGNYLFTDISLAEGSVSGDRIFPQNKPSRNVSAVFAALVSAAI